MGPVHGGQVVVQAEVEGAADGVNELLGQLVGDSAGALKPDPVTGGIV